MNIEKYISSGILEAYVLNDLDQDQKSEVEALADQHMEIQEEILRIQTTLEQLALKTAVQPGAHVKKAILDKINGSPALEKKVIEREIKSKEQSWMKYLVAACVTLLVVTSVAAIYFYTQWKDAENELNQVIAQNQAITQQYNTVSSKNDELSQVLAITVNPSFNRVDLKGLDISPDAAAVIYWNQTSNEVYLNASGMPQPDAAKQYQLWAIVEGKPVDAGVFDIDSPANLTKMRNITNASAFAVTLEPKGGSKSPTLDAMYVMGEV